MRDMGAYRTITNGFQRSLSRMFPTYFSASSKHDHYRDYGWPDTLAFPQFHRMYSRNGLASAAIDKTIAKTWETMPALWETEKPAESAIEQDVRRRMAAIRAWQSLATADRRGMIGAYAGAIVLLRDNLPLDRPVERVPGGIDGLHGILPAWEGQLTVAEWDGDPMSATYGEPLAWQFDETAVGNAAGKPGRQIRIHPDRVLIWSQDGTIDGRSTLESGFNDLIDAEKVKGAGGEGFWKSARGAPVIEAGKDIRPEDVLKMFGVTTPDEAMDKINAQIDDFQSGFDKGLMLGGMTAKPMQITLPQPEEFFSAPVQCFAASMQIPVRILIGNQTGERASTEDAREWAQTCMARRQNICVPVLDEMVRRFVRWRMLPERDWTIGWESLLDATPDQMLDRASKMSAINAQTLPVDEPAFLPNEIREAAGYDPVAGGDDHGEAEDTQSERDPDEVVNAYDPTQPRDGLGRWASSGASRRAIGEFVGRALAAPTEHFSHEIGEVSGKSPPDVHGFTRRMPSSTALHAIREHGDPAREALRGQLPLSPADIGKVPEIVAKAHRVQLHGTPSAGRGQSISYTAKIGAREYTYVEAVGMKRRQVTFMTMWKK